MTHTQATLWALTTLSTFAVGLACESPQVGDPTRLCWQAAGDETCSEAHPGELWFCAILDDPCAVHESIDELGCVTQRPADDCYSPCGDAQSILDDDQCLAAGDGDGDPSAQCGDGIQDPGEACDDGNAINEDECTNACELPTCGDGFVQAGEECDDGNTNPNDGCPASCACPGLKIAERLKFANFEVGATVAVGVDEDLFVLSAAVQPQVARVDRADMNFLWSELSLYEPQRPNLALAEDGRVLVGGNKTGWAHAMMLEAADGAQRWSAKLVAEDVESSIFGVAVAGGHMVAVGSRASMDAPGLLVRIDPIDGSIKSSITTSAPLGPVAVDADGRVLTISRGPAPELLEFSLGDQPEPPIPLTDGVYEELILAEDGSAYLLARAEDEGSFTVSKRQANGDEFWSRSRLDASARGMVLLPAGEVLVAGHASDRSTALLAWYDAQDGAPGCERADIRAVDVVAEQQAFSFFRDVAIAPSGEFGVAVGGAGAAADTTEIWIYEFDL